MKGLGAPSPDFKSEGARPDASILSSFDIERCALVDAKEEEPYRGVPILGRCWASLPA